MIWGLQVISLWKYQVYTNIIVGFQKVFKKYDLLKADNNNKMQVKVTGAQKREVGFILPGRCSMRTKNQGTGRILDENLQKKQVMFQPLSSSIKRKGFR